MLCVWVCVCDDEYHQKQIWRIWPHILYTKFHLTPSHRRIHEPAICHCRSMTKKMRSNTTTRTCIPQMLTKETVPFEPTRASVCLQCFEFRMNFQREVIKMVLYASIVRILFLLSLLFILFAMLVVMLLVFGMDGGVLCFIVYRIRSHHSKLPAKRIRNKKKSGERNISHLVSGSFGWWWL